MIDIHTLNGLCISTNLYTKFPGGGLIHLSSPLITATDNNIGTLQFTRGNINFF